MDALHDALLTASADQLLVIDVDGLVLAVNAAMCDRLGIAREDLLGTDLFALFPPEIAERRRRQVRQAVSLRAPVSFVDVSAGGTEFEAVLVPAAAENGAVSSVVIRARTITPSERVEEERTRLALAIEQAVEAIILLGEDLTVQYVNQAFEEMTGFALQEIRGKSLEILYQGADQKRVIEIIRETLDSRDSWMGRTTATRKDGTILVCEKTLARIRGKRFKALGYVSVWRDITDLVQLERQLRHAQKMEAIATLAGGIAHDFNNILGPIILHAELSLATLPAAEPCRHSFEEILAGAQRAKNLVEQILGLSRDRELDKPICFQLSCIIKECLKLLRPSIPANIRLTYHKHCQEDLILADPTQIHQLFMNLATNAVQAMEGLGGSLAISIDEVAGAMVLAQDGRSLPEGRYLCLEVADTGTGIAEDHLPYIFDPFFTTRKDRRGTGLGLAVVQNILAAIGGAVQVRSTRGQGTTFSVQLPACTTASTLETGGRPVLAGQRRALMVSADPLLIQGSRQALEQAGCRIMACCSAFEALAVFRQAPDDFDLCILDAQLPEMNGVELAREMHLDYPDLPVVLCSTANLGPDLGGLGISACLRKPFRLEELHAVLEKLFGAVSGPGGE